VVQLRRGDNVSGFWMFCVLFSKQRTVFKWKRCNLWVSSFTT